LQAEADARSRGAIALVPIGLLTSVTLRVCSLAHGALRRRPQPSEFLDRLAALGGDLGRRCSTVARSAFERGAHHVVAGWSSRSVLATTLRTPITSKTARIGPPAMMPVPSEAGAMQHAWRHRGWPITAWCSVPFLQRDLDHVAARLVHRLLHRDRHFAGLALAHADAAVAVADHGQRREAEDAAALDDLGRRG
jgi:hypothetical protein